MVAKRIPTLPQQCAGTYFPQFTMVKRKHIDVADRIPLQLTGAGGGGVAFTIVTPNTPEEQVFIWVEDTNIENTVPCKETRLFAIFLYKLTILWNLEMSLNLYEKQLFLQNSFKIL